jgi:hypothetical protein
MAQGSLRASVRLRVPRGAIGLGVGGASCALVGLGLCLWTNRWSPEKAKTLEYLDDTCRDWAALTVLVSILIGFCAGVAGRARDDGR